MVKAAAMTFLAHIALMNRSISPASRVEALEMTQLQGR